MSKVRITAIYEYELANPEFYPEDCKNDEERMLVDKGNFEAQMIDLEEMAKLKSTHWKLVKK